ncbi:9932_t:CDS:2, partial [Paraglomus occultum]
KEFRGYTGRCAFAYDDGNYILHKFLVSTDLVKLKEKPEVCRGLRGMVMQGIRIYVEGILREERMMDVLTKIREEQPSNAPDS